MVRGDDAGNTQFPAHHCRMARDTPFIGDNCRCFSAEVDDLRSRHSGDEDLSLLKCRDLFVVVLCGKTDDAHATAHDSPTSDAAANLPYAVLFWRHELAVPRCVCTGEEGSFP